MSVADITTLQKSMMEQDSMKPFIEKQVLYLNDSNNSSYAGSIQFDTTVLSNSGRYLDYSDATLEIPLVLSLRSSVDVSGAGVLNQYCAGLKSGYYQIIDSIQVDYQNKNVVQQQSFTNFFVGYKVVSEWSADDLQKYGDVTGVWPDTATSFGYSAAASVRGIGFTNNVPYGGQKAMTGAPTTSQPITLANDGYRQRLENNADVTGGIAALPTLTTVQQRANSGKAYFGDDGGAGAARIYSWYMIATIRLKDVCDFFDKIPLLKGAQIRMTINYNATRVTINATTATQVMTVPAGGVTMLSGRTVPFMVSDAIINSAAFANPLVYAGPLNTANAVAGNGVYTIECNIRQTTTPASVVNPLLSGCRLVVPAYTLSPEMEAKYLSTPIKTIEYNDIYSYAILNTAAGGNINAIVTNGILNPEKVIILPFVNAASNAIAVDEFRSPFESAPATTCPLASLTNFQVSVSGKNMFDHPINYDFEHFVYESAESGINGGQVTGLSSGLLSKKMFDVAYRFYVCDVSRRLSASDNIPLAIQIQGINNTSIAMDYYVFVTYKRSIQIETASGVVVQS